ncbi:peroxiredoxin-like 2C [Mercenaria mercenaria]|uniref:peroxiredoxin-like 2C n=1 Tax=Mercenaria mercenaria TaxID=6596 RepID=UPI001E1D6EAB|nr:peroxiredoxin-like 2C [Mercenaria mercenaria]
MADDKDDIREPADEEGLKVVDELKMSRTEEPEYTVNFEKLRDKIVYDGMGNKVKFGDIYKMQKTIIVFVRHLLDFVTKDYVEDLGMIPLEYLQSSDVRLVVIGPAPYKFISDFKKETGFHYTFYCDPDRELYKELELGQEYEPTDVSKSKHVKQNSFMGVLRGMWKIMRVQEWQGDVKQQGGAFILGPGEVVHYIHIDKNQIDHAPINELLKRAGVQQVSFPKDPRVQEL